MKIKDQAAAALMAGPFAVKFICTVICTVDGCGCYERYTTGKHVCVKCQKLKNKKLLNLTLWPTGNAIRRGMRIISNTASQDLQLDT